MADTIHDVTWCEELQCCLQSIQIDFKGKAVILHLMDGDCTDMNGAISLCSRILPDVDTIVTMSGEIPDTVYGRSAGTWIAYPPAAERGK